MILIIVLTIFLLLIGWIIFSSTTIYVNTLVHHYQLKTLGCISLTPFWSGDELKLRCKIFTYGFNLTLPKPSKKKRKKAEKATPTKPKKGIPLKKILNMVRSFKIRYFELSIDTDDYCKNALLVPITSFLNFQGLNVTINFNGDNYLLFEVSNSIWRMGRAYFR